MWQSTQHNRESGSTMRQKRVLKRSVHFDTKEKRYKKEKLYIKVTQEEWDSSTQKMFRKLSKNEFHKM